MNGEVLAALFILVGTIGIIGFASIFGGKEKVEANLQSKEGARSE